MSRTKRRNRRGSVLVLVTLLLLAGALLWTRSGDTAPAAAGTTAAPAPEAAPSEATPSQGAPSSRAEGPAEEDAEKDAEEDTDAGDAVETPAQPGPPASPVEEVAAGPAPVVVALTYTGYDPSTSAVVAGGYAADVVEVDATCTLVLRRDGVELRGEALGTPSATSTDCGEVRVGGDALTSGAWEVVLGYTSETSVGQSAAGEVVVP